ncbi:hypothetical protein BSU04_16650 [Caballeronia sordidicola]|uniref:Uncharacterized protein n=1 Tax=Caballeronia sordidicola TaxID=196367 RepID=A0A226X223_CABSO|nr:hypothetical protein BSU04_16650 [Caballeronia sordidicola]
MRDDGKRQPGVGRGANCAEYTRDQFGVDVGSSNKTTLGFIARARAIATR